MSTLCVVGGGWAGIAAAIQGIRVGHAVTLVEMAPQLGGRARRVEIDGMALDNGQHILIGAYTETLCLMRSIGVDLGEVVARRPLELVYPDDTGLRLRVGASAGTLLRGILATAGWPWAHRLALARAAISWALARFRCDPALTVKQLASGLPPRVCRELIEPLCVAALNTPAARASAAVFLRVLRDALFSGPGSADLLLPRRSLSELLPEPAAGWLVRAGADMRLGRRVASVRRDGAHWCVDAQPFDAVVLACSALEAARLAHPAAPAWAERAAAMRYETIITVYLRSTGTRLPRPMVALRSHDDAPAQFVFDHGALGGAPGVFAAVASGASEWSQRGANATAHAAQRQLIAAFPADTWREPPQLLRTLIERRATFSCTPGLDRPSTHIAAGLSAAGDYIEGPYPATLEGAVRSGIAAVAPHPGMQI